MAKKRSHKELGYEFRYALETDFEKAGSILREHPFLIDFPVYGESESALHFYSTENQHAIVEWLIEHRANPNGIDQDSFPLHDASLLGHFAVCKTLLAAGANPNLKDSVGETALHQASRNGHIEIIRLLLDSGADPSISEMCDELPEDYALPRKADEIRALFRQHLD